MRIIPAALLLLALPMTNLAALAADAPAPATQAETPPPATPAETPPAMVPTRDADVTYAMAGLDQQGQVVHLAERMRWQAQTGMLRVDPPGGDTYMLIDYKTHRLLAVRLDQHAVLEMPADTASVAPGMAHGHGFQRAGEAVVAGLACTEWNTTDSGGQATTVCLTADGVLLRARRGSQVLVQAQSVSYAPADPQAFTVPPGFHRLNP